MGALPDSFEHHRVASQVTLELILHIAFCPILSRMKKPEQRVGFKNTKFYNMVISMCVCVCVCARYVHVCICV